jgi:hypothetical protein
MMNTKHFGECYKLSKDTRFHFTWNKYILFPHAPKPRHLEDVLYLRVNRQLWNEVTIQAIMDRPQPTPVAEVEGLQEVN